MNVETEEDTTKKNNYIPGNNTVIDIENVKKKTNKTNTTEIVELQVNDEVFDVGTVLATGTIEMPINKTVKDLMT